MTQPTSRLANFQYAAPEQKNGNAREVGPQADLYAAGLILNEMFTHEVPASPGYKRIGEVAPSYAFLDAVIESLFQQDPLKRPRSAQDLQTDLKVRAEISRNSLLIDKLSKAEEVEVAPQIRLSVIKKSYVNSRILFEFNGSVPCEWLEILNRGAFTHTSIMGFDTNCVVRVDERTLGMSIGGRNMDDDAISQIVGYFMEWVGIVNVLYKETQEARWRQERRNREESRKREIAKLERENRLSDLVARL